MQLELCFQAWPRIVATATKNNIGAPAARALLEEVVCNISYILFNSSSAGADNEEGDEGNKR